MQAPRSSYREFLNYLFFQGPIKKFGCLWIFMLGFAAVISALATSLEVLLRYRVGERYVSFRLFFIGGAALWSVAYYMDAGLVAFLLMLSFGIAVVQNLLARFGSDRWAGWRSDVNSLSSGESWILALVRPALSDWHYILLKNVAEPGIIFFLGVILADLPRRHPAYWFGEYLMMASAALFIKGLLMTNEERNQKLNLTDAGQLGGGQRSSQQSKQQEDEYIASLDPALKAKAEEKRRRGKKK